MCFFFQDIQLLVLYEYDLKYLYSLKLEEYMGT